MGLAVLDFKNFSSGSPEEQRRFCQDLCEALSTYGFAKIRNSSFSDETIDALFRYTKSFFSLPDHVKAKAAHPEAPNPHRGWSAVGKELISRVSGMEKGETPAEAVKEIRESFDQGSAHDVLFPNRWVDEQDLPGFRKFMEDFYVACYSFHNQLIQAISIEYGLPPDVLLSKHQHNTSELRILHYPPIPCKDLASAMRIAEHSDFGTLTLLLQDSVGGLQVEDQKNPGQFIPIFPESQYEVIVNVGDCLQRWTNEQLRSANHRVTLPEGKDPGSDSMLDERHSVAYFGKPDRTVLVDTMTEFCQGKERKYNDHMTAFQYNQYKLLRTYV